MLICVVVDGLLEVTRWRRREEREGGKFCPRWAGSHGSLAALGTIAGIPVKVRF